MRPGARPQSYFSLIALPLALLIIPLTHTPRQQPDAKNGERIYRTATSARGDSITADLGERGMMRMMDRMGGLACINCHGPSGKGGEVRMMMQTFTAPDIRYASLTGEDPDMEHPPYTDRTIKRAITEGLNPAGDPLESPMPKWKMSDADLNDLIAFLKTLK